MWIASSRITIWGAASVVQAKLKKIIRNCTRAHVHDVCNKQKSLSAHNSKEYFQCFVFQLGAQDMTIRWPRQVSPSRSSDVITVIISVIKLTHSTRLVGQSRTGQNISSFRLHNENIYRTDEKCIREIGFQLIPEMKIGGLNTLPLVTARLMLIICTSLTWK